MNGAGYSAKTCALFLRDSLPDLRGSFGYSGRARYNIKIGMPHKSSMTMMEETLQLLYLAQDMCLAILEKKDQQNI